MDEDKEYIDCSKCLQNKPKSSFIKGNKKVRWCKQCRNDASKYWRLNNKDKANAYNKEYKASHKEEERLYNREYYKNYSKDDPEFQQRNREKSKIYYEDNREIAIVKQKEYQKRTRKERNERERKRRAENLGAALRIYMSNFINRGLKKMGSSKNGESISLYIEYNMQQLVDHLVSQMIGYNAWMHLENHGKYDPKTWNDNDTSTWTWQIDHIIPQSDLPYESMEDENFKKCWALENLRPLSAKQNLLDGVRRTRHKNSLMQA